MSCKYCKNGATCRGMCPKHYMRWVRHGDPHMVKRPSHPVRIVLPVGEIVDKYQAGLSLKDLAYDYYCSHMTIRKRLVAAGVQLRRSGRPRDPARP